MLSQLARIEGTSDGCCVASTSAATSDSFIILHHIGSVTSQKKKVLLITSKYAEMNYRLMAAKLAVRWDRNLIRTVPLNSLIGNRTDIDMKDLFCQTKEIITSYAPSLLIFDDFSVFERLGLGEVSTWFFALSLNELLESGSLIYLSFGVKTKVYEQLLDVADCTINIKTVGSGFSKDISGKMIIGVRKGGVITEETEMLYLTGERSVKCFYPGSVFVS